MTAVKRITALLSVFVLALFLGLVGSAAMWAPLAGADEEAVEDAATAEDADAISAESSEGESSNGDESDDAEAAADDADDADENEDDGGSADEDESDAGDADDADADDDIASVNTGVTEYNAEGVEVTSDVTDEADERNAMIFGVVVGVAAGIGLIVLAVWFVRTYLPRRKVERAAAAAAAKREDPEE